MSEERRNVLESLELYRSSVDAASNSLSQGLVAQAYRHTLGALMNILNFADNWYKAQINAPGANVNLMSADRRVSIITHLLLSRRICDLTGKVVALNVQRRLLTRDSILNKVLANRKISDTSAALLFRLENITAAFGGTREDAGPGGTTQRPEGFPEGQPDSLSFIDTSKSGGYRDLVGVSEQTKSIHTQIQAGRVAKTSTMILLYGPPGTGKTSLVVAAARENDLPVVTVTASNLGGEFIGEREQNTADLFDYLEKVKTDYILFIDEADSFLPEQYDNNTQSRLTRVLTINRMLRLVGRNDGVARVVMLASNYDDRIARDVAESSFKLYLNAPSTVEQMKELFSFYRERANMNLTPEQLDYAAETALRLKYAPGHVSLVMQRLLTNSVIKLLNNRVRLEEVGTDLLVRPIYMVERNRTFEDGLQNVTIVLVSDEPRTDGDDDSAAAWERANPIAFPVPDMDVDFASVSGQPTEDGHRAPPPAVASRLRYSPSVHNGTPVPAVGEVAPIDERNPVYEPSPGSVAVLWETLGLTTSESGIIPLPSSEELEDLLQEFESSQSNVFDTDQELFEN